MRYQVKLTATVNEIGKKFSPEVKVAARVALNLLAQNPHLGKELHGDLMGFRFCRFLRNRIIYRVNTIERIVLVWAIGHRPDMYENFSELILKGPTEFSNS